MSTATSELLVEGGGPGAEEVSAGQDVVARSPLELFWRRFRTDKVALAALAFIVLLILVAIFAPLVIKLFGAPPPATQNPNALAEFGTPTGPSSAHIMGVDQLGRDIFSRVVYGARVSLEVAIISTSVAVFFGVIAGMIAAYYGGGTAPRVLRRGHRPRARPLHGRHARLPEPAAGHRPGLRLLARQRLPRRPHPPGP